MPDHPKQPLGEPVPDWKPPPHPMREVMQGRFCRLEPLGYRRYEWKCDSLNEPWRKAALRVGLSFEGIFRQATVRKGRKRDAAWYAAIDKKWPALRAAFEQWLSPSNFDEQGKQRVSLSSLTQQAPAVI